MANNISAESLKDNSEASLDVLYRLWSQVPTECDEKDMAWSNYAGALWTIEKLNFRWTRDEKGIHNVIVPKIHY